MAALTLLWGCESTTGEEEFDKPETKYDEPVGSFFRTAATTSQDQFNYQAAAKYYQNLYSRDPDDIESLLGLVRNLRYIGSASDSLRLLDDAMEKNPDVVALKAEYAKSLVASGRSEEAIERLNELLTESPDDWELLSALGIAYDLTEESDDAERSYRAALAASPDNTSIINNLALSLALSGKIDEGAAMLEDMVNRSRSTPHMRQNLALMYAMKGDVDAARRLAEQDLPEEQVNSNVQYYERLYSLAEGGVRNVVEVSRLEEPAVVASITPVTPTQAPEPTPEPAVSAPSDGPLPPIEGIKVQLGVYNSFARATAGLSASRDGNVDLLSGLRFVIDKVDGIDDTLGYVVMAGPLVSVEIAADLCTKLHSRKEVCRLILP